MQWASRSCKVRRALAGVIRKRESLGVVVQDFANAWQDRHGEEKSLGSCKDGNRAGGEKDSREALRACNGICRTVRLL